MPPTATAPYRPPKVYLPPPAALPLRNAHRRGVGGLSWAEVAPLADVHLASAKCEVYLYAEFEPGIAAEEPGLVARLG